MWFIVSLQWLDRQLCSASIIKSLLHTICSQQEELSDRPPNPIC